MRSRVLHLNFFMTGGHQRGGNKTKDGPRRLPPNGRGMLFLYILLRAVGVSGSRRVRLRDVLD